MTFGFSERLPRCLSQDLGETIVAGAYSKRCHERIEQNIRGNSELNTRFEYAIERGRICNSRDPLGSEEQKRKGRRTDGSSPLDGHTYQLVSGAEQDTCGDAGMEEIGGLASSISEHNYESFGARERAGSFHASGAEEDPHETGRQKLSVLAAGISTLRPPVW